MPLICLIDLITRLRSKKISKENVCVQIILGRKKVWVQICFMSFKSKIKVEFDTVRQSLVSIFLLEMIYML